MHRWARSTAILIAALVSVMAFSGVAQAATTVALWHMDSLPMVDSSGNGNTGTPKGITVVGGAYKFIKGSSVTVPDAPELDPGTATIRITARVNFSTPPSKAVGDYDLIRKGVAGTKGGDWKMEILPTSANPAPAFCLFQDTQGKQARVSGSANLANGAWHTITCVKTASAVTLIVDGVSKSVSARLGAIANSQPVVLGQKPGGGDQYVGLLDETSLQIG